MSSVSCHLVQESWGYVMFVPIWARVVDIASAR